MGIVLRVLLLLLGVLVLPFRLPAQSAIVNRVPAVAGTFYAGERSTLRADLASLFARARPSASYPRLAAVIVPHAGYVYSGEVAASAFNQIDPNAQFENIFILGPSHRVGFDGAAVYVSGNFLTPLGTVSVDTALGRELIRRSPLFVDRVDAHRDEHCIEVTLPFLQYHLKRPFTIVPIVIASDDPNTCRSIARLLQPHFSRKNLFVISTDFSHYPSADDATRIDAATADAVCSNSTDRLLAALQANGRKRIPELATSMCGWPAVLTLLAMTEADPDARYHRIQYRHSGDVPGGDRSRVVGYHAIAVTLEQENRSTGFELTKQDRGALLRLARSTIERRVAGQSIRNMDERELSPALKTPCGAFVTLKESGQLRGCIGRFDATEPLYRVVQQMAIAAATEDPRFPSVQKGEMDRVDIEISVLTPMKKISSVDEIQMGKHGIYIKKGNRSGTFLPQVATETGWTKGEFLGHCAQDKAGLGWNGWKDAEIFVYEAVVFGEKEDN